MRSPALRKKLTPLERYAIKGAIRRVFRQSDDFKAVINAARVELPPALKKDGTPGKKNQVRFTCAVCKGLFPQKWISVDHIQPVVPLWERELEMSIEDIVYGIYCDISNLQVICSTPMKFLPKGTKSCHSKKTNFENFTRDRLQEYLKDTTVDKPSIYSKIDECRIEYDRYLKEQEDARLAKEKRKADRAARAAQKRGDK